MESLGNELKAARAKRNISLKRIAEDTRINLNYLSSLEEGRYGDLPGGMYNRAFLRAYCDCLGLDTKEFLHRYEVESAPPSEKAPKSRAKAFQPVSYPQPHPVAVWSVLLVATIAGLYLSRDWITSVFSPYFSRPPASKMLHPTQIKPSAPPAQPAPAVPREQQSEPLSAPAQTVSGAAAVSLSQETKSEPPAPEEHPAVPAGADSRPVPPNAIRIRFHALQKCWMSVSSDGNRVFVKILEPGDDRFFDAAERFIVILGNAGGVRLLINGIPAKPLGKPGEVVKVLINEQSIPNLIEKGNG